MFGLMSEYQDLSQFLKQNPHFDFYAHGPRKFDAYDWSNLDRNRIIGLLHKAEPLRSVVSNLPAAVTVLEAGYDSVHRIARRSPDAFKNEMQAGLGLAEAELVHRRARGHAAFAVQRLLLAREARSPLNRGLLPRRKAVASTNVVSSSTAADESESAPGESVHYETIFGEALLMDIPEEMSILGAGAYFMDLMDLIADEITALNSGIPEELALRARRPDLWNLPITMENIADEISYADLTLGILEATLLHHAPSIRVLPGIIQELREDLEKPVEEELTLPPPPPGRVKLCADYTELQTNVTAAENGDVLVITDSFAITAEIKVSVNITIKAGRSDVVLDCSASRAFLCSGQRVAVEDLAFTGMHGVSAIKIMDGTLLVHNCLFETATDGETTDGWALRASTGEATMINCTVVDTAAAGPAAAMIAVEATSTLSLLNSILWTAGTPAAGWTAGAFNPDGAANFAYCDVRGGDPGLNQVFFANTNFESMPRFQEENGVANFLLLENDSPCIGRGGGGRNVGAARYSIYSVMREAIYPLDMPFNLDMQSAYFALNELETDLAEIYEVFAPFDTDTRNEYTKLFIIGLSIADYGIIRGLEKTSTGISAFYGLDSFDEAKVIVAPNYGSGGTYCFLAEDFARMLGLTPAGLRELVYQDLSPAEIEAGVQAGHAPWTAMPGTLSEGLNWPGFFINPGPVAALSDDFVTPGRGVVRLKPSDTSGDEAIPAGLATLPLPAALTTGSFSLGVWLLIQGAPGNVLSISDGTNSLTWKLLDGEQLELSGASPAMPPFHAPGLMGRWNRLTTVYDATHGTFRAYLNDEKAGSVSAECPLDSTKQWSIAFYGDVDQFACEAVFYNYTRSAEEIARAFTRPPAMNDTGLVAYWAMNDLTSGSSAGSLLNSADSQYNGATTGSIAWGKACLPSNRESIEPGKSVLVDDAVFVQVPLMRGTAKADLQPNALWSENLDRIHRFVRLARRTGWTFAELDWALYTICTMRKSQGATDNPYSTGGLSLSVFNDLADMYYLQRQTKLSIPRLCSLLGYLKPFGRGAAGDERTLFDDVYNRPPLSGMHFTPSMSRTITVVETPADSDAEDDAIEADDVDTSSAILARRIASNLGVSTSDLFLIAAYFQGPPADGAGVDLKLNWRTLTNLFRFRLWMSLLAMTVEELIEFAAFTDAPFFETNFSPTGMFEMLRAFRWSDAAGIDAGQLQFMVTDPSLVDPANDPYQESLIQRFENRLDELNLKLRRDLENRVVTPGSFVQAGIDEDQSADFYEQCITDQYINDQGIVLDNLLKLLPAVPLSEEPTPPPGEPLTVNDLYPFAFEQLAALRKQLQLFFDLEEELPLDSILYFLSPRENGLEILTKDETDSSAKIEYLRRIYQYILSAFHYELDAEETTTLLNRPGVFALDAGDGELPLFTQSDLRTLARYLLLKKSYPDNKKDLLEYLIRASDRAAQGENLNPEEAAAALADIYEWNEAQVLQLLENLYAEGSGPPPLPAILSVFRAVDLAEGTNLPIARLRELNRNGLIFGAQGVTPLLEALKGSAPDDYERIHGEITEMKRRVLNIFALPLLDERLRGHGFRVRDENELSEYLLLDMGMGARAVTSPVLQAGLSLQQYVERCRLGLEPGVRHLNISDTHWSWMSSYRKWEANRKVFTYPENFLRPELRDYKTPQFEQLENDLAGADITPEKAEEFFRDYLSAFASVSNLRTIGAWYEQPVFIDTAVRFEQNPDNPAGLTASAFKEEQTLQYFTAECWIKFNDATAGVPFYSMRDDANGTVWELSITTDSRIRFEIKFGTETTSNQTEVLAPDTWHHIAAIYSSYLSPPRFDLCYNGDAAIKTDVPDGTTIQVGTGSSIVLGGGAAANFDGVVLEMAEVRFWKTNRPYTKITSAMFRHVSRQNPTFNDLIGLWAFRRDYQDQSAYWEQTDVTAAGVRREAFQRGGIIRESPPGRAVFIARTPVAPYSYYIRELKIYPSPQGERDAFRWGSWRDLPLQAGIEFVAPIVFDSRTYLFWVETMFQSGDDDSPMGGFHQATVKYVEKKTDGSWSSPRSPFPKIPLPPDVDPTIDPAGSGKIWNEPYVAHAQENGVRVLLIAYGDFTSASQPYYGILRSDGTVGFTNLGSANDYTYGAIAAAPRAGARHSPVRGIPLPEYGRLIAWDQAELFLANDVARQAAFVGAYYDEGESAFKIMAIRRDTSVDPISAAMSFEDDPVLSSLNPAVCYGTNAMYFIPNSGSPLSLYWNAAPWAEGTWIRQCYNITPHYSGAKDAQLVVLGTVFFCAFRQGESLYILRSSTGTDDSWRNVYSSNNVVTAPGLSVIGDAVYVTWGDGTNLNYVKVDSQGTLLAQGPMDGTSGSSKYTNSPLVYWQSFWYFAFRNGENNLYITYSEKLNEGWTYKQVHDRDGSLNVQTSGSIGLRAVPDELYISYIDSKKNYYVIRNANPRPSSGSNSTGWYSYRGFPIASVTAASVIAPGVYEPGPGDSILEQTGPEAYSTPMSNQLGAIIFGNSDGEYLVQARQSGGQVNAGVEGELYKEVATLRSRPVNFAKAEFRFTRLTSSAAENLFAAVELDGIEALFQSSTQKMPEAVFRKLMPGTRVDTDAPPNARISFDLSSAYGLYYRELYFFAPWLIAEVLRKNNRYDEARRWLEFIFRPADAGGGDDYWRCEWLANIEPTTDLDDLALESEDRLALLVYHEDPFNANALADLRPAAYQKTIFMAYIGNLLDWADYLFAANTRETINEAAQLYRFSADLLGPRPRYLPYVPRMPETYAELSATSPGEFLIPDQPMEPAPPGSVEPNTGVTAYDFYFAVPDNPEFLRMWDRTRDRLFKIRRSLSLDGEPNLLPLFDPPLDPMALVRAAGGGGAPVPASSGAGTVLDFNRIEDLFYLTKMLAQNAVEFGQTLLRALEMKDGETLAALQAGQQTAIAARLREIRTEEVNEARANLKSLEKSRAAAEFRKEHYTELKKQYMSPLEITESVLQGIALPLRTAGILLYDNAVMLQMAPPFPSPGESAMNAAMAFDDMAALAGETAGLIGTFAGYQRRAQEWKFEADLAQYDIQQLDAQVDAASRRAQAAELQYELETASLEQTREIEAYYRDKFTNAELYGWMADTMSDLYSRMYQVALGAARAIEEYIQVGGAPLSTSMIGNGDWNGRRKGLLAGESLLLDLSRLEQWYLNWTASNMPDAAVLEYSLMDHAPESLPALRIHQECILNLDLTATAANQPGMYQHRLKSVSLEFSGLQDETIHGELIQETGSLPRAADAITARFLMGHSADGPGKGLGRRLSKRRVSFTTRAGSTESLTGLSGAPLFGRYRLRLTPAAGRVDLNRLRDIRIRFHYEARFGGEKFREEVIAALPPLRETRLVDLGAAYPEALRNLRDGHVLIAPDISPERFSRNLPGKNFQVTRATVLLDVDPVGVPSNSEATQDASQLRISLTPVLPARTLRLPLERRGLLRIESESRAPLAEVGPALELRAEAGAAARAALRNLYILLEVTEE